MVFGFALFAIGYVLFYWGLHHMPGFKRYSLWTISGLDAIYSGLHKGAHLATQAGTPVQFQIGGSPSSPQTTQPQQPTNQLTPSPLKGGGFSPVQSSWKIGRTDQGVDFSGGGEIYAINAGTIINVYNTGWPGGTFIVLKLDNPPAGIPSPDIYYAEDIVPAVTQGQHVSAGQYLGMGSGGPSGIEIGFADPTTIGQALAARSGGYTEGVPTQLGQQFRNWITTLAKPKQGGN